MNETPSPSEETSEVTHRSGMSRGTIITWLCLLWVFVAFCTFWKTIDNIDVDGALKTEFLPFESIIDGVCLSGLAAVPLGFGCGLWAFIYGNENDRGLSFLPTLALGLLFIWLACNLGLRWIVDCGLWNGQPPISVPASVESLD